jgi:hypothetical protein
VESEDLRLCLLCGSVRVWTRQHADGTEFIACRACHGLVRIHKDPPDEPGVDGRVEVLLAPVRDTPAS